MFSDLTGLSGDEDTPETTTAADASADVAADAPRVEQGSDGGGATDAGSDGSDGASPFLDDFNRADGDLGQKWTSDSTFDDGVLVVENQRARYNQGPSGCGNAFAVWKTMFGFSHEVSVRVVSIPNEGNFELRGKIDAARSNWLSVRFFLASGTAQVNTLTADIGQPVPVPVKINDRIGARFHANGTIEVLLNGVVVGTRTATDNWAGRGGYIGIVASCAGNGAGTVVDDFAGGSF